MKPFPPGSWGLEEFCEFELWYNQLREATEMTKSIREVFLLLRQLSLRMLELNEPLQLDEEGSDLESDAEHDEEEPTPPPVPSTSQSVIKSQPRSPMYNATGEEVVPNDTRVRLWLFLHFISWLKRSLSVRAVLMPKELPASVRRLSPQVYVVSDVLKSISAVPIFRSPTKSPAKLNPSRRPKTRSLRRSPADRVLDVLLANECPGSPSPL